MKYLVQHNLRVLDLNKLQNYNESSITILQRSELYTFLTLAKLYIEENTCHEQMSLNYLKDDEHPKELELPNRVIVPESELWEILSSSVECVEARPKLKKLCLIHNSIGEPAEMSTDLNDALFAECMPHWGNMRELHLQGMNLAKIGIFEFLSNHFPHLRDLKLINTALVSLEKLSQNKAITNLNLSRN